MLANPHDKRMNFDTVEQQMRSFRDRALFSASPHERFNSIKALAKFGEKAIPYLKDVLESDSESMFKQYCLDMIEKIKTNYHKTLIPAGIMLLPCLLGNISVCCDCMS